MKLLRFIWSKLFLKQLGLAVIAAFVIGFFLLKWLDYTTNHGKFIEVPQLEKQTIDVVEMRLNDAKLRYEVQDSANYDPKFPQYSVIEQSPEAGTQVKKNRKIYLTINPSGYRKVSVPNVIEKSRRNAEPTLRAHGFQIGDITFRSDMATNAVLEMRHNGRKLEPGSLLPRTSKIDLVLGDGKGRYIPKVRDNDDDEDGGNDETR